MSGSSIGQDELYSKITEQVGRAVTADTQSRPEEALSGYNDALKSIQQLILVGGDCQRRPVLIEKFCEYANRAGQLLCQLATNPEYIDDLERAHATLYKAREARLQGDTDTSLSLFISGIGSYQKVLRLTKGAKADAGSTRWSRELRRFANLSLKEAEDIKYAATEIQLPDLPDAASSGRLVTTQQEAPFAVSEISYSLSQLTVDQQPLGGRALKNKGGNSASSLSTMAASVGSGASSEPSGNLGIPNARSSPVERLAPDETDVVRHTSHINGLTFLPWLTNDIDENFAFVEHYTDKDGLPSLSSKQQRKLWRWRRASQLYNAPQVFGQIGCEHIVQETVTDCSFVAALCVSVEYERRFRRQVISRHLYPLSSSGVPLFNPSGKYMAKLFVNGLWRRVVIDDQLPTAEGGRLLCTYSTANDIGPSLMEKAFLKVMGGYEFPGSNSSTDLHVLTGWIPEHVFIQDDSFNAERMWQRMCSGARHGDVMVTIATGEMSTSAASALGLVPAHAYAVLDIREACGHRLLKVKNPWSSLRWTGCFSHADHASWTPELMQHLCYDPVAESEDCGLFWIDYDSVCQRFDAIHLNWNPQVFAHATATHLEWPLASGPRQALYDFSANPQYTLTVGSLDTAADADSRPLVWILLSKHLLKTEENTDFIALHVYNGSRRIYEPRSAMRIGEYVNTPHVLMQFSAEPGSSYTLVVAQRNKTKTLYFTLRVFCDAPLQMAAAPTPAFKEIIQNQWGSSSAGGNTASSRYLDNPQYRLKVGNGSSSVRFSGMLTLEAAQKYPVNLRIFRTGFLVTRVLEVNTVANSGKYRTQFCSCSLDDIEAGSYTVVVSTFEPFMFSRFKLSVELDTEFTLTPIPREGAGMRLRELHGSWAPGTPGSADSPRFLVRTDRPTKILVRLQTPMADPLPLANVSVFASGRAASDSLCATSGSYTNSPQGVATQLTSIGAAGRSSDYVVVASTWDSDVTAPFVLYLYSEHSVEITPLHQASQ
ncbi:cysteine protease [Coemansia erecta]|uniref:Cysteine protease n=1 Tax=Coemansia erecta TaxID=147472 RepID=A0A9W7Y273_9FUNG|nr:cysteine protease [Coemansia erecta]